MTMWRITRYHADENGEPVGEPFVSDCYTEELMNSYKNPQLSKLVVKIEQYNSGKWQIIYSSAC